MKKILKYTLIGFSMFLFATGLVSAGVHYELNIPWGINLFIGSAITLIAITLVTCILGFLGFQPPRFDPSPGNIKI